MVISSLQQIRRLTRVLQSAKAIQGSQWTTNGIHKGGFVGTFCNQLRTNTNTGAAKTQAIEDFLDVKIDTKEEVTYVEGVPVSTGREDFLVNIAHSDACALCRLNLKNLEYTDVMILSQWIKKDGTLATYEESKLCMKQFQMVKRLIRKAQRCNLIARPADYFVPGPWHDLNTYLEPDRRRDQPMKVIKKEYWK